MAEGVRLTAEQMEEIVSLMFDQMVECAMLDRTTVPDGFGGFVPRWTQGASFKAAIVYNSSIQARVAEVQGVKGMYTVTVPDSVQMEYHDVFVRIGDGVVFRCVSKDDNKTPAAASFHVRTFNAEEWAINKEGVTE